jgi:hypothetical protein
LVAGEDSQILDLVAASAAAVCAIIAYEGAIAKEEEVGVGVEERAARVAAEAVEMPPVASCSREVSILERAKGREGSWTLEAAIHVHKNHAQMRTECDVGLRELTYLVRTLCPLQESRDGKQRLTQAGHRPRERRKGKPRHSPCRGRHPPYRWRCRDTRPRWSSWWADGRRPKGGKFDRLRNGRKCTTMWMELVTVVKDERSPD